MELFNLLSLTKSEIKDYFKSIKEQPFRGEQVFRWMHKNGVFDASKMSNLPKEFRKFLIEKQLINNPLSTRSVNISKDGSVKFLFYTKDDYPVESVLIPSGRKQKKTYTLCVSSQSGCAMNCSFCSTAKLGLYRNLNVSEIVNQANLSLNYLEENTSHFPELDNYSREQKISNLVFMGMGEPLLNLDNVISSVKIFEDEIGLNFSGRRITISTCGIIPQLEVLSKSIPSVNLAVSLNAPTDKQRNRIMPINHKYSLSKLMEALRNYPLKNRRRITFEYIMFKDFNDTLEDAKKLASLVNGIKCKFNIIPYNVGNFESFLQPSPPLNRQRFAEYLRKFGFTVIERNSYGQDISGACGQLAAISKQKLPPPIIKT